MSEITQILREIKDGDPQAAEDLLPLVYDQLRRLAANKMSQQPPGQTLQATALVHEAWLKLSGNEAAAWKDRQHFFRAAAEAMRQILIDRARAKQRLKRGAGQYRTRVEELDLAADTEPETLLLVDEALQALAEQKPKEAELVKLRFYVGLSVDEAAQTLGLSEKTVRRQWIHARAWLFQRISRLIRE